MFNRAHDARVRTAVFEWLTDQVMRYGDVLPREALAKGFFLDDIRVPLVGPRGIFKPRSTPFRVSMGQGSSCRAARSFVLIRACCRSGTSSIGKLLRVMPASFGKIGHI